MSAAARKRISEMMKKRWAARKKAAAKKSVNTKAKKRTAVAAKAPAQAVVAGAE
jgi:hypothetical protein